MSYKRRGRSFHIQSLEARVTPSGVAVPAAIVDSVAAQPAVIPLLLSGEGVGGGQFTLPDGTPMMINAVQGQSNVLGQFSGQLLASNPDHNNIQTVMANFSGDNGASLRMTIWVRIPGGQGDGDPASLVIHGNYLITGGTGTMSGAHGSGAVTAVVERDGNGFGFTLQGQVSV